MTGSAPDRPTHRRKAGRKRLKHRAGDFRALSHRILQAANRGVPRDTFQRDVSRLILDFSGCDAVELWLKEHGKYFRCETLRQSPLSSFAPIKPCKQDDDGRIAPGPEDDPALIHLCRDVISGGNDSLRPFLTAHGSFWTGNSGQGRDARVQRPDLFLAGSYLSLLLIPLSIDPQNIGMLQLKSTVRDFFQGEEIERYEGLAQTLGIALAHRHAQVDLRERVKELTCLYGIARVVAEPTISLEAILRRIVELLPSAWLYPDIAFARIVLDGRSYAVPAFTEGVHRQTTDIVVNGETRGRVEVVYSEEKPEFDEGPFYTEERNLLDAVAREVSTIVKRKEAEDEQSRLQEQLRHADRLATLGQLAASMAHELNEPLSNILGFGQLAKKCPGLPIQAGQDIDKILAATLNARDVIRKILIFARQMPQQKRNVDLNRLVEECLSFLESRFAAGRVDVVRLLSPDLPEVVADPTQLSQVLVNLIINAVQAMPQGGRLTIQTRPRENRLSLIIEDSGVGMTEEVRKQIFTPFFTTKEIGQGTGLGLAVVHGIVTSHGGSIDVKSKAGAGTRFEIRLPVPAPGPAPVPAQRQAPASSSPETEGS
jgi:two-component system NtrC family sensor kinase